MSKGKYIRTDEQKSRLKEHFKNIRQFRSYSPRTIEEKTKISEGTKKGMAGKSWNSGLTKLDERVRRYSSKLIGRKFSDEHKRKLREKRVHQKFPTKETGPERKVREELDRLKISYESQKPLLGITIADFYISDRNIALYVDGDYWHNLPNYRIRDARINASLKEAGYKVYRVWEKDINEDVQKSLSFLH
jgi:G:T-mismatch repair DNA endonuclease (very short patch repair protein)